MLPPVELEELAAGEVGAGEVVADDEGDAGAGVGTGAGGGVCTGVGVGVGVGAADDRTGSVVVAAGEAAACAGVVVDLVVEDALKLSTPVFGTDGAFGALGPCAPGVEDDDANCCAAFVGEPEENRNGRSATTPIKIAISRTMTCFRLIFIAYYQSKREMIFS